MRSTRRRTTTRRRITLSSDLCLLWPLRPWSLGFQIRPNRACAETRKPDVSLRQQCNRIPSSAASRNPIEFSFEGRYLQNPLFWHPVPKGTFKGFPPSGTLFHFLSPPPEIGDCHLAPDCYALGLAPVTRMQGLSLLRGAPKTDQLLLDARKAEDKND